MASHLYWVKGMDMGKQHGITLIELMIVVVIVAIIASIAYPSYREQMQKTRRADAHSALMDAAARMERRYTQFGSYSAALAGMGILATSPEGYYGITATLAGNPQTFLLTASPIAGSAQDGDGCGNFTINQAQVKTVSGSLSAQACNWD